MPFIDEELRIKIKNLVNASIIEGLSSRKQIIKRISDYFYMDYATVEKVIDDYRTELEKKLYVLQID